MYKGVNGPWLAMPGRLSVRQGECTEVQTTHVARIL